jgi:hypothetical protein
MVWFGTSSLSLYNQAGKAAQSAFNSFARTTRDAVDKLEESGVSAAKYSQKRLIDGYDAIQRSVHQAEDYGRKKLNEAKENVQQRVAAAKRAVDRTFNPQPAGARIQSCPKNKAERVRERKAKIRKSKEMLSTMAPGKQRDVLAHATERFERNNVAVERARLAGDTYNVGKGDPPEGWERITEENLKKLGMEADSFPQLNINFRQSEYPDGYYPELYKMNGNVFGEERYVLAFRGTQGVKDGKADILQAFGEETDQYTRAIQTAQKLKKILGNNLDIAGHSMGGGMATAAGIVTGSPVYAIDPAGVHPATLERFGRKYTRDSADEYVQNFVAKDEILDAVQQSNVQRAILAGISTLTPVGGGMLAESGHRSMTEKGTVTYGAAGPIYKFPILGNAKKVVDGKANQGMSPGLGGRLNNRLNPIQKVNLHDPNYVIAGMEQQKTDDLNVMERSLRK